MAVSSTSDCYLCGARNEPEASYCVRCNGQLLSIPAQEETDLEFVSIDDIVDDISEPETLAVAEAPRQNRRPRKGSLQDQRLSDALGLQDDVEIESQDNALGLADTVVTSIPRATPSADIPLIGTRAGAVPQSAMQSKEFGRRTYILLALLLLATAWLGYGTVRGGDDAPDSIAFTSTIVPPSTTSSTIKPDREWRLSEVDGRFAQTFVRIDLIRCPLGEGSTAQVVESVGVAINTNNVIIDATPLPAADIAWVRSRTGSRRLALLERTVDGLYVATAMTSTSRNLGIEADSPGEPAFFVSYDPETNDVETSSSDNGGLVQILVSPNGDAHSVRIGGRTFSAAALGVIDTRIERDEEVTLGRAPTACERASALQEVDAADAEVQDPDNAELPTGDGEPTE